MRKTILIPLAMMLAISFVANAAGVPKGWEQVKTEYADAKLVVKEPEIEIFTYQSMVIVNTSKPVKIQIFTILGRLVSSETLPAGASQLAINAHGVYIVKVGELTCKIAI